MKTLKIISLSFALIFVANVNAQNGVLKSGETIALTENSYKAHAEGWMVDVDKARAESEKTGKPIMANFTGSDWCGWCKKLKREVFDTPEFKAWAKKNVVLLELDFPRRFQLPEKYKQQNAGLQQAFKVSGYPTIWVFKLGTDEQGKYTIDAYGKTGYVKGTKAFTSGVDSMIKQHASAK